MAHIPGFVAEFRRDLEKQEVCRLLLLLCKGKRTNISPYQLHLPVGPTADQLHFVKVGELHLQLLQLFGRLLIYRVDTLDTHVNHILKSEAEQGSSVAVGRHAAAESAVLIQCWCPDVLPSQENTENCAPVGTYIG